MSPDPVPAPAPGQDPAAAFRDAFGAEPEGVWHGPGRVNVIGEHTDYNDGLVLPIALPQGITAAVSRTGDRSVQVVSHGRTESAAARFGLADLAPGSVTGWAAYVAGVFWALREAGHEVGGARISLTSDLPIGSGLSSSAALETAVAVAVTELYGLDGLRADLPELARLAQRAENGYVGAPTGILDQSAALRCVEGRALYLDCRSLAARNVPFDLASAGLRLLVIDTRVHHSHAEADGGYRVRRAECERAAKILGVPALRDVEDLAGALRRLPDPVLRDRVQHVVTEIHRVNATVGLLRAGAYAEIGTLLSMSHLSLRDQFRISCPELDLAVETAVAAGARGARMTGGGFGGSAIALVAADRLDKVREAVTAAFRRQGWTEPGLITALPSPGARRVDA
ncbi:galactokinase [Allonocardiopsis opalescens]|uniref:Galactokinase n=1 Tax=Allonocardiopsis opalescens TaxID=1144618 RepID=A0A2T0PSJ3_9ACTN|nr:galactokinase [Allonocardiopsis opalescens]PRX91855.1 galactokinase [Allonocardiopsis opalescens]